MDLSDALRDNFHGRLLGPDSPGYDAARRVWNGNIDRHPALLAQCTGVADVQAALRFARERDLEIAVRGGGHNVAGLSTCDGGIVIDLGPMKGVRVDPVARTATAGPGVIWREFDRETQAFGLATPGGTISDTGIAGLTLGGGLGYLSRRFGLTADNLLSADVVTADGDLLRVSDDEHPDLMWGLRGGGGNFGIVSSFTYRLHELAGPCLAGFMIYKADRAGDLIRFARDWAENAPDEAALIVMLGTAPADPYLPPELHDQPIVMLNVSWSGPVEEGERQMAALRAFAPPVVDLVEPVPYTVLQRSLDPTAQRGHQYYIKASFLRTLDDTAVDDVLAAHARVTSPNSAIGLVLTGGAVGRAGSGRSAFAHREAGWFADLLGQWHDPDEDPAPHVGWVRDVWRDLERVSTGSYVNHLDADEIASHRGYDEGHHDRLAALKTQYDPENVFRLNANIRPRVPVGA